MLLLGIDPGLSGALAVLSIPQGRQPFLVDVVDMPTVGEDAKRRVRVGAIAKWLDRLNEQYDQRPARAYVERAQAMPDQGASSGFIYGRAVGAVEACILCCGIPLFTAEPQTWKKHHGLIGQDKSASLALARKVERAEAALEYAKDHNRAEAILIALWGAHEWGKAMGIPGTAAGKSSPSSDSVPASG